MDSISEYYNSLFERMQSDNYITNENLDNKEKSQVRKLVIYELNKQLVAFIKDLISSNVVHYMSDNDIKSIMSSIDDIESQSYSRYLGFDIMKDEKYGSNQDYSPVYFSLNLGNIYGNLRPGLVFEIRGKSIAHTESEYRFFLLKVNVKINYPLTEVDNESDKKYGMLSIANEINSLISETFNIANKVFVPVKYLA